MWGLLVESTAYFSAGVMLTLALREIRDAL